MKDLLTIEEVAQIAKVSAPTIYRRIKKGSFPKPKKTKRPTNHGPKTVNRWERAEVMGWLMKGNDPEWLKQPIRDIEATVEKVDAARQVQDFAPEDADHGSRGFWNNHVALAIIGGLAAAVAYAWANG